MKSFKKKGYSLMYCYSSFVIFRCFISYGIWWRFFGNIYFLFFTFKPFLPFCNVKKPERTVSAFVWKSGLNSKYSKPLSKHSHTPPIYQISQNYFNLDNLKIQSFCNVILSILWITFEKYGKNVDSQLCLTGFYVVIFTFD